MGTNIEPKFKKVSSLSMGTFGAFVLMTLKTSSFAYCEKYAKVDCDEQGSHAGPLLAKPAYNWDKSNSKKSYFNGSSKSNSTSSHGG